MTVHNTNKASKAVVLLSGGLDSTTVLAIATSEGYRCYCLSFQYGQRQAVELECAKANAVKAGAAAHLLLHLDLDKIGGSALTANIEVPKNSPSRADTVPGGESTVPLTYVPGRNTIFLSHAIAWAEVIGACDIFIGVNVMDYSGYPDCRPAFLQAFEQVANLGTRSGTEGRRPFTLHAPLMRLTKKEIILKGLALGVDYAGTHSCYDPDNKGRACGACDACRLRLKGFAEAGVADPIIYQNQ